jgi:hypothetical protein
MRFLLAQPGARFDPVALRSGVKIGALRTPEL